MICWCTNSLKLWLIDGSLIRNGWSIDSLISWFNGSLLHWFVQSLIHFDSLTHWVVEPLIHWFIGLLLFCFIDSLVHFFGASFIQLCRCSFMSWYLNNHLLICWCTSQLKRPPQRVPGTTWYCIQYTVLKVFRCIQRVRPCDPVGSRSSPKPSGSKSLEKEQATQPKSNTKPGCFTFGSTFGASINQASYLIWIKSDFCMLFPYINPSESIDGIKRPVASSTDPRVGTGWWSQMDWDHQIRFGLVHQTVTEAGDIWVNPGLVRVGRWPS